MKSNCAIRYSLPIDSISLLMLIHCLSFCEKKTEAIFVEQMYYPTVYKASSPYLLLLQTKNSFDKFKLEIANTITIKQPSAGKSFLIPAL